MLHRYRIRDMNHAYKYCSTDIDEEVALAIIALSRLMECDAKMRHHPQTHHDTPQFARCSGDDGGGGVERGGGGGETQSMVTDVQAQRHLGEENGETHTRFRSIEDRLMSIEDRLVRMRGLEQALLAVAMTTGRGGGGKCGCVDVGVDMGVCVCVGVCECG